MFKKKSQLLMIGTFLTGLIQACSPLSTANVPELAKVSQNQTLLSSSTMSELLAINPDNLTAPPKGITAPPRGLTAPPKGFTIPPRSVSAPPKGFTLTEGKITFPGSTNKDLFSVPPRGLTAPPKGFTVPPLGVSIPTFGITIPPRGFETLSLEPSQAQKLTFHVNGTLIPQERVLIKNITKNSNGDLEVSFMTNGLPQQDHLIFSATSPSGLVVMGQYLESTQNTTLNLNLEETAIALIKSTPQGAKQTVNEIRQHANLKQLVKSLQQTLQQGPLAISILEAPAVQQSLNTLTQPSEQQIPEPLSLNISSPGDASSFTLGSNIDIKTTFNDPQNQIASVTFLNNFTPIGSDDSAPYTLAWDTDNITANTIKLTAVAKDAKGDVLLKSQAVSIKLRTSRTPSGIVEIAPVVTPVPTPTATPVPPTITSLSQTFAAAGASITINGTGFDPTPTNNTVTFNGTSATVNSATTTTLDVTVPVGATAGPVSVSGVNGPVFTPTPTGLIHHWSGNGNAQDSGGNAHGTLQNGATFAAGKVGQAFSLDGVNDYVDVGTIDMNGSALTIAAWFKMDTLTNDPRILSKSIGANTPDHWWMVGFETSGVQREYRWRLKTSSGGTSEVENGNFALNTWTFVTMTYDGSQMRIYENGNLVASQAKTGTLSTDPTVSAWIGGNPPNSTDRPFDGLIDEVQMYNRALSQAEIQAIHTATL